MHYLMFGGFRIARGTPFLSTNDEVDAAEQQLGLSFPSGYREYVTRFGEGALGGSFIRIYPPHRIQRELAGWRERIDEYWFWHAGRENLTKADALHSVIIGDTVAGDELIVRPENSERILVLPRYFEEVFVAGDGLPSAIEWLCNSGKLVEPFSDRNVEPFTTRSTE